MFGDVQGNDEMYDECGDGGRMVRLSGDVVVSDRFGKKRCCNFFMRNFLKRNHLKDGELRVCWL